MRRWTGAVAVGLVLVLTGAACSKKSSPQGQGATPTGGGTITIAGEKANNHGTKSISGGKLRLEADNEGTDYYFDPTTIKGQAGQTVTLTIKDAGKAKHNFTVKSQGINQDLKPGQTVTVKVTIPKSGSIEFHCEYHQSLGMVGQLEAA